MSPPAHLGERLAPPGAGANKSRRRASGLPGLLAGILFCALASAPPARSQAPLDGVGHVFHDELLDKMVGAWNLTGTVAGRPAEHSVEVAWVLNHQFLRIQERDRRPPAGQAVPYEAAVFVGYDNASERYVAHWIDVFGGRFSETLGYGHRSGDSIEFVFEYPEGPFHTTFRWNAEAGAWQWDMRQKNDAGKWEDFARFTLTREAEPKQGPKGPAR